MRYRIVDVFTERPLEGNALCVVLDPCPEELMPRVARETNLSETTFPFVTAEDAYRMRIFTPGSELPFAGHPSIGTAWVLGAGTWEQTTSGAVVSVEADARGAVMTQPDPVIASVEVPGVPEALGIPGVEGTFVAEAAGNRWLIAATEAPIGQAEPDLRRIMALGELHETMALCAVRRVDDANLHVRVFVPAAGIAEDPGTGSAAGPISMVAREHWGVDEDLTISQGAEIGRPCRIEVHAEPGALRVGGAVTPVAEGDFTL